MKRITLVLVVVAGFAASALMAQTDLGSTGAMLTSGGGEKPSDNPGGDNPPDKPSGDSEAGGSETPPDKPSGEGGGEGEGEGGEGGEGVSDTTVLTGVLQLDSGSASYDGGTLESTNSDENVILVQSNACLTISNYTLNKSGDTSSEDNSNFFALNAVVASKTGGTNYLDNCVLNSNAEGANCMFASGSGSTIYAYNCEITSMKNSSRGLDATYEGTVIASKLTINTSGDHCASLATDRGNGYISATDSTLSTAGQGSALIYSTGVIEVNGVTGTATGAQIAGIEGLSEIRIKNSNLSGSGEKASEPVANGVIIYQSNSGDSTDGTATFEVSDSTLNSAITNGAMFYVTHSAAFITVQNTEFKFDADNNYLLNAAGNDGENGWGNVGSNGAEVVFTAIDQTLTGNIAVDGISSVDLYLTNSTYTGTFEKDATNAGDGDINVFVSADSTWTVTADCTLKSLTVAAEERIKDGNGAIVSIVDSEHQTLVSGNSDLKVTVANYTVSNFATTNITSFTISRTAFGAMYGTSESQADEGGGSSGGSSGGVQDHNNWTNYFKPHPPENAIVKVKVDGATDYGTPDRDHKYCLDGYWDGSASGIKVRLLYVTQEGYLFSEGCTSNVWETTVTNNAQEVYPPDDVVAIKAQAKSGSTDYLTLKAAIEAAKSRAKISLYDDITLEETLTITNSITLNLATNTITLSSTLTNAFHITANVTVSNGTITSSLATNAEDSGLLNFTECKATLSDLTISGNGYLLYIGDDASVTLTNNCALTCDNAASIYCADKGKITLAIGTYKSDGVELAAPDGCRWENGWLVADSSGETITPGIASEPYDDAESATNAVNAINADKESYIAVPTGVEGDAKTDYLSKVEAMVTSDNCVVVDLTPAAQSNEQVIVDAAVTNETAIVALTSTNELATVTIATTTPGLYYWIEGGIEVSAVTNAGVSVLSTTGGSVELSKPTLDTTKGKAFFKIAVGVK